MARNAVVFPLIGAFAAFMAGCAVMDTGAFTRLQDEMVGLKKEMAVLKTAPPPAPVPAAERANAGHRVRAEELRGHERDFDRVKSDQLAATTRMDEARVEMQRIAARQERAGPGAAGDPGERRPDEGDRNAPGGARGADRQARRRSGRRAPAPETPREWKSPEEMYEVAVGQVKGGNPKKGRETLSDFAVKYPDHKLIPNALYWKGEAFYAEKDFENAILTFQDVVDKYPRGEKAPDAMYKQGLSFLSLNDKKNAGILFDLVQKKYPKSKAAEMAKKKLKEIR